jgi:Spy/CpxP family protein refolding chaperone
MFKTLFIFSLLFITPSLAQHKHDPQSHAPYAGLEKREIKALSDEQIKDLKSGKGMTLALAAELNGYPGPAHVLELADKLNLTSKQQTQDLFKAMSKETKALGAQLIKEEKALDLLFKNKKVNPQNLKEATLQIGQTQAKLREAHLRYHLSTVEILTPEQIKSYNKLRGYK